MEIEHISVSRQKCFETCGQQYKFKYHLKMPSPKPEPFYFAYGKVVHKIAEHYVDQKGEIPIGDIMSDVVRGKIPVEGEKLCPPIPDDYKKKLIKHVRAIQNLTDRIGCDGIVEHPFLYALDESKKKCVKGFIDRLIIKKDASGIRRAFILDYKTTKKGKFRVNGETVKTDLQLRAYARIVQKEFGIDPVNIKAALYYLEGENLIAAQYSEESLEDVERQLLRAFNTIEKSDPDKVWGKVGWHCQRCDYEQICPFYKGKDQASTGWDGDIDNLGGGW
jgi:CRISPR/Cas system-associated exonuclease Cas4 (RecB family)